MKRILLLLTLGAVVLPGQTGPERRVEEDRIVVGPGEGQAGIIMHRAVRVGPPYAAGAAGAPEDVTFEFVASEAAFEGRIVKGAPYSADTVSETTQVLADGTRISRKNTGTVYRDSEGRTRREQTLAAVGPWAAAGDPPRTIFINDPVSGQHYILDPRDRTARKMPVPQIEKLVERGSGQAPAPGAPAVGAGVFEIKTSPLAPRSRGNWRTESLGKQLVEGVQAEGTRTTMTIPVGEIGNDRPIEVVSERWYSPELQTVVLSKHSDPRMGETIYRLTNIRRSEPLRSLFEVPSDYTLREKPAFGVWKERVEKK